MSLGRRFWAAHRGAVGLAYAVAILTCVLMGLLLSFMEIPPEVIWANLGYAVMLTTGLVAGWLLFAWLRWAPFSRALLAVTESSTPATAGALPSPGTADQAMAAEAIAALFAQTAAERSANQAAHHQHLSYITLWVHQMKAPVSVIHLLTQNGGALSESATRSIEEEADRLSQGLDQALAMARLTQVAADFRIERVDLLAQVRAAITARKKQLILLGLMPQVEADGSDWTIRTDPKWHRFVLDQILSNAIKYGSQAGRKNQQLRCRLWREGERVHLAIQDEGPGIPQADLPRIFEPFFTGQNGRRYADATGMGLYLVRRVLDQVGHTIDVQTQEGKGTTVVLTYST